MPCPFLDISLGIPGQWQTQGLTRQARQEQKAARQPQEVARQPQEEAVRLEQEEPAALPRTMHGIERP